MNNYNFDILNWIIHLVPTKWRGTIIRAYLYALVSPLQSLNDSFQDVFVQNINKAILFNGQVIYLEHLLNDKLDNISRRITITDGLSTNRPTLRNVGENRTTIIFRNKLEDSNSSVLFIRNSTEAKPDFIIHKNGAEFDHALATTLVNQYKITAKSFSIN